MKQPDKPGNETARLAALRSLNILDAQSDERFDRLARMAKRLFDVPVAVVSLIEEDRLWFRSCEGIDVRETPRELSFCGHAILGDDLFVVPNAAEDERFFDNPFVSGEAHFRFYAGCPIRTPDGYKLGTLCILDREPRDFSRDQREALKDLAAMVESEISALYMATQDELTGLSNRRGFMLLAQQSLSFCARNAMPATLVFIDLDKFKNINDENGHEEGDRALIRFARKLNDFFRKSDVCARLGGDEFVILLPNETKPKTELAMEKLRRLLEKENSQDGRGYDIEFTHGIVECTPTEDMSVEDLLAKGDGLMYEAKKSH